LSKRKILAKNESIENKTQEDNMDKAHQLAKEWIDKWISLDEIHDGFAPVERYINSLADIILGYAEKAAMEKQCPECQQNHESGMNFCANCGRQLWQEGV